MSIKHREQKLACMHDNALRAGSYINVLSLTIIPVETSLVHVNEPQTQHTGPLTPHLEPASELETRQYDILYSNDFNYIILLLQM